jgi:hypothetical protein
MSLIYYFHTFASIAITALILQIFSTYWLPLCLGALAILVIGYLFRR